MDTILLTQKNKFIGKSYKTLKGIKRTILDRLHELYSNLAKTRKYETEKWEQKVKELQTL